MLKFETLAQNDTAASRYLFVARPAVHPRYQTAEMAMLWSDEYRLRTWLKVELAALEGLEAEHQIPEGTSEEVRKRALSIDWSSFAKRMEEKERVLRHDVIAFLTCVEEDIGPASRYIHFGLTSSDVLDTAFALLLKQAGEQLQERIKALTVAIFEKALAHKNTLCLGRTHGQAAELTTFGIKLLGFVSEMKRHQARLLAATQDISFGKMSGAVGNYANASPEAEAIAMTTLGLQAEPLATQVIPRDRHAHFFSTLAILAGGIDRLATEIRHLSRSEVSEAFEPFFAGQRGSSAMPHKKNPILCENVSGLCRTIRNMAGAAFENQVLWHERDISHSSVERIIAPQMTTLLDFALQRITGIVNGLEVNAKAMAEHIERAQGVIFSESILLKLIRAGVARQEAYGWVQGAAHRAYEAGAQFKEELRRNERIAKHMSTADIEQAFDMKQHLAQVDLLFARCVYSA
jgi:adenylosuccinate lyase